MEFFDCNVFYGLSVAQSQMLPVPTVGQLQTALAEAGVAKAVVWRIEQHTGAMMTANRVLAEDIRGADNLYGTWSILPSHTHEMPAPDELPPLMKANRIIGWRLMPKMGRYFARAFVLGDYFKVAVERKIPVFISTAHGARPEDLEDILKAFPQLTVVLTYASDWPSDRAYRPFVKEWPNLHIDLSYCIGDAAIESFCQEYGPSRLLYGSNFPDCYFGGLMQMVRHAGIPIADREAIAGGNLGRIVQEVRLD
jgi:predicted TIM-barrel fold metal-dependent hydrolase